MKQENKLLDQLLKSLDDIQAIEVQVMDVKDLTPIADYMVVCSGRSTRHVKAIARQIIEDFKKAGNRPLSYSGLDTGEWALVDFGDVILHVMLPASRAFYNIEGLWSDQLTSQS